MRARNIKPGFFINEDLLKLKYEERILFVGLWCLADREGFFEKRPKQIKLQIFPNDNKVNIEKMLCNLMSLHLITCDDRFGYIPNFAKHQKPHPHEAKSTIPESVRKSLKNGVIKCNDMSLNVTKCSADIRNDDIRNEERGYIYRHGESLAEARVAFVENWNNLVPGILSAVTTITTKRKTAINARLNETKKKDNPQEYWTEVIKRILSSEFCIGNGPNGWKANFDWLIKPDTHIQVMEGKYDNKKRLNKTQQSIVEVVKEKGGWDDR